MFCNFLLYADNKGINVKNAKEENIISFSEAFNKKEQLNFKYNETMQIWSKSMQVCGIAGIFLVATDTAMLVAGVVSLLNLEDFDKKSKITLAETGYFLMFMGIAMLILDIPMIIVGFILYYLFDKRIRNSSISLFVKNNRMGVVSLTNTNNISNTVLGLKFSI